jgi:hypothetical protein
MERSFTVLAAMYTIGFLFVAVSVKTHVLESYTQRVLCY